MKVLLIKKNAIFFTLTLFSIFQNSSLKATTDSIDFFNVGQGHATLINKAGAQAPLLIDAGSMDHPAKIDTRHDWMVQNQASLTSQISERILKIWRDSNEQSLSEKKLFLNVIISHPDKDHKNFIPLILKQLKNKVKVTRAPFCPSFLLGGNSDLYPEFLEEYKNNITYSDELLGLHSGASLKFFNTSNCITHLFCLKGSKGKSSDNRNSWSIITRIQMGYLL